jgi:large subunit ribosomal protein L24
MAAKIKKGDRVVLLAGKDKGRTGQVAKVFPKEERVLVVGPEHGPAPHQADPRRSAGRHQEQGSPGARLERGLVDSKGKPTRVGFRIEGDKKVRVAKTTGEVING